MPTYAMIDGVSRELTSWPAMVDGVSRELDSMIAAVDGVQREIFSGRVTWWEKHIPVIVTETEDYAFIDYSDIDFHSLCYSDAALPGFTLYLKKYPDLDYGNDSSVQLEIYTSVSAFESGYTELFTEGRWVSRLPAYYSSLDGAYLPAFRCGSYTRLSSEDQKLSVKYTAMTELGAGTYLGDVSSSDETAYPDNGLHSDGYWYVRVTDGEAPKELSYIESSGTQYIDLGFVPDADTEIELDFQLTTAGTGNRALLGVAGQFSFRWYGAGSVFRSNGANNSDFPTGIDGTARHKVVKKATSCILDDTYTVTNTAGTVSLSLYLLAQHAASGATNPASAKVYSLKRRQAGTLVNDWVPWRTAGGKVGLLDKITNTFFENAGTGEFTGG